MVTNLLQAPLLVLLTNVDGLFTADPRSDPDAQAGRRPCRTSTSRHRPGGSRRKSALGTGGMRSKLRAARLATAAGGAVIMANGSTTAFSTRIFAGEPVGTLFLPHARRCPRDDAGSATRPGPRSACARRRGRQGRRARGRSLLPVGVLAVVGTFGKGDVVSLCDRDGIEFARGLTNYSSADAERIRGLTTEQILRAVGKVPYVEMVHRDNLAIVG